MALMKRKTFEFDDTLAADFEQFCRSRMLVEKRVVESLVLHFMQLDAEARENILLGIEQWYESQESSGKLKLAASGGEGKVSPPRRGRKS